MPPKPVHIEIPKQPEGPIDSPYFPLQVPTGEVDIQGRQKVNMHPGIGMRAHFAGLAMKAIIQADLEEDETGELQLAEPNAVADLAILYADALMKKLYNPSQESVLDKARSVPGDANG